MLVIHRRGPVALGLLFGGFLGYLFHGPGAGDVGSGGGAQGPEVGLGDLGVEGFSGHVEIGERFAIDFHGDFTFGGSELHLSDERQGDQDGGKQDQTWVDHRNYSSATLPGGLNFGSLPESVC